MQVKARNTNEVETKIFTGCGTGEAILFPHIPFISTDFQFKRLQCPILAYLTSSRFIGAVPRINNRPNMKLVQYSLNTNHDINVLSWFEILNRSVSFIKTATLQLQGSCCQSCSRQVQPELNGKRSLVTTATAWSQHSE